MLAAWKTSGLSEDHYAFVSEIASGGMGRVDLVVRREGDFERLYALKRLHPTFLHDAAFLRMFTEEARLAGLLRHANVVSVLDVGEDTRGPFLLMDYIEGVSLLEVLEHHQSSDESLPVQLCLRIICDAAAGLHAAHELRDRDGNPLSLVHRDVSPANILLGLDGVVRVSDFGVAKALGPTTQTYTGSLKGKFGYMSPEQLRFKRIDRRSDLFALGVCFYELLSSSRLYGGPDGPERILEAPPPDVEEVCPDASPQVVQLVLDLLAKEPDHRPATALEVASRLEEEIIRLASLEGPMPLRDYVAHVYGKRLASKRGQIAKQLRDIDEFAYLAETMPGEHADDPRASEPTVANSPAPRKGLLRRRSGALLLFAASSVLISAGGGLAWMLASEPSIPADVAGPPRDMTVPPTEPPENVGPPTSLEADAPPRASTTDSPENPPSDSEMAPSVEPTLRPRGTTSNRRSRTSRSEPQPAASSPSPPLAPTESTGESTTRSSRPSRREGRPTIPTAIPDW